MILSVFVEGDPIAQPRARAVSFAGRARMYDPGTAKPWRARIAAALASERPTETVRGPVALTMRFYFRRPASHLKPCGGLRKNARLMPVGRPDFDNLQKAVADELTQLSVWGDDSQVVDVIFSKRYAEGDQRPGVQIEMREAS